MEQEIIHYALESMYVYMSTCMYEHMYACTCMYVCTCRYNVCRYPNIQVVSNLVMRLIIHTCTLNKVAAHCHHSDLMILSVTVPRCI